MSKHDNRPVRLDDADLVQANAGSVLPNRTNAPGGKVPTKETETGFLGASDWLWQ